VQLKAFYVLPLLDRLEENLYPEERYAPGAVLSAVIPVPATTTHPLPSGDVSPTAAGGSMDSNLSDNMLLLSVRDSSAAAIQRAYRRYRLRRGGGAGLPSATPRLCRTVQERVYQLIDEAMDAGNQISRRWGGSSGIAHPWMTWAPFW
jgi:hypothetical protein